MDGTTMEAAGSAGLPGAENRAAEAGNAAVNVLKGVGWFSVGLVALAVEGTGWLVKAATQKGKEAAPAVAKPFKSAGTSVEEAFSEVGNRLKGAAKSATGSDEAVERALDARINAAVERVGAPVIAEISDLKARLEDLAQKIDTMQDRRERRDKPAH